MSLKARHNKITAAGGFALFLLSLGFVVGALAGDQSSLPPQGGQLAVPATFVREIRQPGLGAEILRPSAIHFDDLHHEILVADPGHNRVVIFSQNGAFKFAFDLGDSLTTPADVVTDPEGTIFVLGTSKAGRALDRFDFDGFPMVHTILPATWLGGDLNVTSLACDDQGHVFGLDSKGLRILKLFPGPMAEVCALKPQLADNTAGVYGLGNLAWDLGEFLLPVATSGFVLRYGTSGEFLGTVGHGGSKPGALAFPVAVERSPEGIYLVLDTNRFCVVCYGPDGAFLGEFGGKGLSPGWFISPSLLAALGSQTVAVGQIFENRIQIVGLPLFIRKKVKGTITTPNTAKPGGALGMDTPAPGFFNPRRFSTVTSCKFTCGTISGSRNLNSVSPSEASS